MTSNSKPLVTKFCVAATVGGAAAALMYYVWSRRRPVRFNKETVLKNINIVNSKEDWDSLRPQLLRQLKSWPVLGMDCEWVTRRKRKPVALLQLAAPHGLCLLIRQSVLRDVPPSLRELLADRSILKVGVAVDEDGSLLMNDYNIQVNGCLDLTHMVLNPPEGVAMPNLKKIGLAALSQEFAGLTLNKRTSIRISNWEAETLSDAQIKYAAMDALAALLVFEKVSNLQVKSSNWKNIYNTYEKFLDLSYSNKVTVDDQSAPPEERKIICSNRKPAKNGQPMTVSNRKAHTSSQPLRKTPLYYNCELRTLDDQILCTCSPSKVKWFLDRELATLVSEDPLVVRLTFEPKGRPELDNMYYTLVRENVCVVCGKDHSYLKKKIIPHEYRRYFPNIMKDHQSHDILLMCFHCHRRHERNSVAMRQKLAEECDSPIFSKEEVETTGWKMYRMKSTARALQNPEGIPKERIEMLEERLKTFLGKDELTREDIDAVVSARKDKSSSNLGSTHGFGVVQYYAKKYGLVKLARLWRENFVISMQPKHLPKQWSLDHNHERLKVQLDRLEDTETPKWDYVIALEGLDSVKPNLYLKPNMKVCEKSGSKDIELVVEWRGHGNGENWDVENQERDVENKDWDFEIENWNDDKGLDESSDNQFLAA